MIDLKCAFPKATTAALALVLVASGCVRGSTFRTEVATLREEMRASTAAASEEAARATADVDRRLSERTAALEARLTAVETGLRGIETQFNARVERMEQALRVHTPIEFGFDEAAVPADQTGVLDRIAGVLEEYYPQALVTVEGFTDSAGSASYNLRLGQRRADAVRAHLTQNGLGENQVRAVSYGEDTRRLVSSGSRGPGEQGRANRRVVIVIEHPTAGADMRTSSGTN